MARFNVYRVSEDTSLTMESGTDNKTSAISMARYSHKLDEFRCTRVVVKEDAAFNDEDSGSWAGDSTTDDHPCAQTEAEVSICQNND